MKILFAYNRHRHHGGGGDKYLSDAALLAAELGHEIRSFTRSSEDLPKGLRGHVMAASSIFSAPESVREFTALLDGFSPDLIHAGELFPLVSPHILPLARERRIPVVLSVIDYRITCPVVTHLYRGQICTRCCGGNEHWALLRNCRGNLAESASVFAYSAVVRRRALIRENVTCYEAPSQFVKSFLARHASVPLDRISVRNPLIEPPENNVPDPAAGSYIGFAGRFTAEKGVQVALEAARISELPVRFARNIGSFVQIPVPGALEVITRTSDDLAAFYRGARAFIVPGVWYETFCMVAAEAMSHGVPVIVSAHGALRELVNDGIDGLHFTPGDARDLAAKMKLLWENPALCRRLGTAAREKAIRVWGRRAYLVALARSYETTLELSAHAEVQLHA